MSGRIRKPRPAEATRRSDLAIMGVGESQGDDSDFFLLKARFAGSTASSYAKAVRAFLEFCQRESLAPVTAEALDLCLTRYIHVSFRTGVVSKSSVAHALSGVVAFCPALKDKIPTAWASFAGWDRLCPAVSHPPMVFDAMAAVAVGLASVGASSGDVSASAAALGVFLAFHCYFRVGELCKIRLRDLAGPGDARLPSRASADGVVLVRLPQTKTGIEQFVYIRDQGLADMVFSFARRRRLRPDDLLLGFSAPRQFSAKFGFGCARLGLAHCGFVPHSLRHGGATHDFLAGDSLQTIMFRGRWKSAESAKRYIQAGRARLLSVDIPTTVSDAGRVLGRDLPAAFRIADSFLFDP